MKVSGCPPRFGIGFSLILRQQANVQWMINLDNPRNPVIFGFEWAVGKLMRSVDNI